MSSARVQRSHQERGDGAVPLYPLSRTARTTGSARTARSGRRAKQELPEEQKKELKEAFELFDTDKVGSIDYHELKVLMRALGFQVAKREVLELVEDVDVQRSGRVDFNDYMEISKRLLDREERRCAELTHRVAVAVRRKVLARDPDEEIARVGRVGRSPHDPTHSDTDVD
ncbi:Centrin-3 [Phytophthora pseudosyringae]|uniref:Centrin-3 n=1 Tax=Phytophthora pseudosyringae TaxID=221518 RepID=A0A8T1VHC3_9STRA|nr:Centrin-3 [Phytophthora pseudosyringae]